MSDAPAAPELDEPRLLAAVELVGRMAANALDLGWSNDSDVPEPGHWYASARWKGARHAVEDQLGPAEAVEELGLSILAGSQCVHCGKLTTAGIDLGTGHGQLYAKTGHPQLDPEVLEDYSDGDPTADLCVWHRDGEHWLRGRDNGYGPTDEPLNRDQRRRQDKAKRLRHDR